MSQAGDPVDVPLAAARALDGLQVVEVASYVAAPSAGLTLGQMGASVVRVDPPGGAPDHDRWPLAPQGGSLYWSGLNRFKQSVVVDIRRPEGQELVLALAATGQQHGGVLVDNLGRAPWLGADAVRRARGDMVHARVIGRPDGGPSLDYTANAAAGIPHLTGAVGGRPVNHVLPAWDLLTGLHVVVGVLGALRRRDATGAGAELTVSLDEVAMAGVTTLGWAADAELSGDRERYGNHVYGGYGNDFETRDRRRLMVVALTERQWRALTDVTATTEAFDAVGTGMGLDLHTDAGRFAAREVITAVLRPWFAARTLTELGPQLDAARVLWGPYRSVREMVAAQGADGPGDLLHHVEQQGVGAMLTTSLPVRGLGPAERSKPAPRLGEHTVEVLADRLGLQAAEIGRLVDDGVVVDAADTHTPLRSSR